MSEVLFVLLTEIARADGGPLSFTRMAADLERAGRTDDARMVRAAWIEAQTLPEAEQRRAALTAIIGGKAED